ncbi:MAG TPA: DUF2378 family protein [Myxococcaceae bacterium]|nr:DUF2378 family protein [Myxococcaceae bacterium]
MANGISVATAPAHVEETTDNSAFEGLFQRALNPQGAFADELRAAGYDLRRPSPKYPTRVWRACLEVALRHVHPGKPPHEGIRLLGHAFIQGFFHTIVGKLVSVALPLLGPDRIAAKFPKYWEATRPGVKIDVIVDNPHRHRLLFRDPHPMPDFVAGIIEAALQRAGRPVQVEVGSRAPISFEIIVTTPQA